MMLHQDGSTHEWVPGCQWDLIVTLEDATSEIYSAFFLEEEGTLSRFRGLREVMETQGLFSSLYTDRSSHYWHTDEAGDRVDKTRLTQVHRALQQLGITLIPAYSPEARGRSERAFRTRQDRLPNELALAGITEMAAANRYLTKQFLPSYNKRFMVPATDPGTAFIPWIGTNLTEILYVQEERVVAQDDTVHYHHQRLQIPQTPHRFHYVKVTVRGHAYPDETLAVFHGPRCLVRYHADGRLIETGRTQPGRSALPHDRTSRRSSILGQRCATQFRRAAERFEGKNRTDHVLHTPDNLTCYLQMPDNGVLLPTISTFGSEHALASPVQILFSSRNPPQAASDRSCTTHSSRARGHPSRSA